MSHKSKENLPYASGFMKGAKVQITDDPNLLAWVTAPVSVVAQWLTKLIQEVPESIMMSPPMQPILARENVRALTVASVVTKVLNRTESPNEVHFSILFELLEELAASGSRGLLIRGRATVVVERQGSSFMVVQSAHVIHGAGGDSRSAQLP